MRFVLFVLALLLGMTFSAAREHVDLVFSGDHGVDSACVAKYDYRKCIRCYCCQEMCPAKAITVKRGMFSK